MLAKGWRAARTPKIGGRAAKEQFFFNDTTPGKVQWARFDHRGNPPTSTRHEMMLNTDMCLAYANHHGQPVLASRDECCAWFPVKSSAFLQRIRRANIEKIVANSDGTHCGETIDFWNTQFVFENHKGCCGNRKWLNCGNTAGGAPQWLGGPAEADVFEFAASESVWLSAFLRAWKRATENGQEGSLQPLRGSEFANIGGSGIALGCHTSAVSTSTRAMTTSTTTTTRCGSTKCEAWCARFVKEWHCSWKSCSGCPSCGC